MSRPGLLRFQGTIEQDEDMPDGSGGQLENWQPIEECVWYGRRAIAGRLKLFADRLESNVTHELTVRVPHMLKSGRRIVDAVDGRVFVMVNAPTTDESRGGYARILASERGE